MKENIILLHGALGSQQQMQALAPLLSPHFAVHSLNFLGHGGDPSETHFTMKALAQQVKTFIEEKQLGRTHIFGYSMGGYVALNLALDHPEQIQSIVTFGTKFNWSKEAAEKEVKMLNPELIEAKVPQFAQRLKDT
ncbi:MAG: alpha/beta fold hydrolase, partial [Bacteroidota bacterium]